ncbi:MAG: sigma-70 family RNA polymerase sigma factor [Lachnospiraceae bacterium]|nr:sigma-70 family RNA polymerase sigma factor [Lachnospiraceae bacterium]
MDVKLHKLIGKAVENAEKNGGDLTTLNLKYVYRVAMDISNKTGVDVYDLFAEGVIGMKKSEEKYDPSKNDNFVKYAASSVRGYMLNLINRQQNLVHIPVNHLKGFKKGQETHEDVSNITYDHIDSYDYDSLGTVDHFINENERDEILQEGIRRLDENGRIAIKIKLRLGEYEKVEKNNMQFIADELEVPVAMASKIYKDALKKLTKYCQSEING